MTTHASRLLALLFVHGDPIHISEIQKLLSIGDTETAQVLEQMNGLLVDLPFMVMNGRDGLSLVTRSEYGEMLAGIKKALASTPLSKAALETLTLIVYLKEASKSLIDSVRSVNSALSLRNLVLRGLIEKHVTESQTVYRATQETFEHLGITDPTQLPNYEEFTTLFAEQHSQQ